MQFWQLSFCAHSARAGSNSPAPPLAHSFSPWSTPSSMNGTRHLFHRERLRRSTLRSIPPERLWVSRFIGGRCTGQVPAIQNDRPFFRSRPDQIDMSAALSGQTFTVRLRFHGDLSCFLPKENRGAAITKTLREKTSVKDVIESCGVPHPEVDLICCDGVAVCFEH